MGYIVRTLCQKDWTFSKKGMVSMLLRQIGSIAQLETGENDRYIIAE